MGHSQEDEPLTLMRYPSYMKPLGESPVCGRAYNLKALKEKISYLSFASLLLSLISWHDVCRSGGGGRR